jgi:predicted nucleic acid-binding protein
VLLDAAAIVDLLLRNDLGRTVRTHIEGRVLWSVVHLDAEVFSALARLRRDGRLDTDDVQTRLELLASLPLERLPITGSLLSQAWALRDNIAARAALYVAAARPLGVPLLTTDRRLQRAASDVAVELAAYGSEGED